ncbi:phosphatase PAP2 family protein [Chitinophaga sp. Cy-1792]|uniref:phosphatase PAP2 family protein n=1 Tax=Chitinophaga sp. Cy-1792 TaxID=2608339 RepID=UPI001F03DD0E|nr:phosphatase PAP2 family protein [Chitinophaga sp. Cy-1792]
MKKSIIITGLSLACMHLAVAQTTDSLRQVTDTGAVKSADTISLTVPKIKVAATNLPSFQTSLTGILVPAAMIGYGFIALNNHSLLNLNHSTKAEIIEDHPHFNTGVDNFLQYSPVAAVYILNAAGIHGKHNLRDRTIILGISALITGSTVQVLKTQTHEERPDGSNNLSFPSGHTATAFAAAEFLRQEYKDVSPWYGVGGYIAATATGALRMYNNRHWLSDVVAGAGIGILGTKAAYWIYPFIQRKLFPAKQGVVVMPFYDAQWKSTGLSLSLTSF